MASKKQAQQTYQLTKALLCRPSVWAASRHYRTFCGRGGVPGDSGNPQFAAGGVSLTRRLHMDMSGWPPKLQKVVERAFAMCATDRDIPFAVLKYMDFRLPS